MLGSGSRSWTRSALSRRHIWAGMHSPAVGLLLCRAEGQPSSLLLCPDAFPLPSLALGRVVWQRILLRRAGGRVVVVLLLVDRAGAQGGAFLPFLCCLLLDHQLMAVPELRDLIPSVLGALLICSGLCWNLWISFPLGASELSSWLCQSLEILSPVGAVVLGLWSLRIPSLVGALESWHSWLPQPVQAWCQRSRTSRG